MSATRRQNPVMRSARATFLAFRTIPASAMEKQIVPWKSWIYVNMELREAGEKYSSLLSARPHRHRRKRQTRPRNVSDSRGITSWRAGPLIRP